MREVKITAKRHVDLTTVIVAPGGTKKKGKGAAGINPEKRALAVNYECTRMEPVQNLSKVARESQELKERTRNAEREGDAVPVKDT